MAVAAQRLEHIVLQRRRSVLRPVRDSRTRRVPFALFALSLIATVLLGLVTAQTLVTQDSFRLAELNAQAERLEMEYGRLRLQVAELSSPEQLARAARKAGMVLPERVELLPVPPAPARPARRGGGSLALKGVLGGTG